MKMTKYIVGLILISIFVYLGCTDPPEYPNEPVITFEGMTKTVLQQGALNEDSTFVTIGFTDGDGNLGSRPDENQVDVFLYDKRDGFLAGQFRIPFIPQEGAGNGISGSMTFQVFTSCCISEILPPCEPTPDVFPIDTLIYQIQIMDRDSNFSNIVETLPILLQCD